jgi:hypothetical protein
MRCIDSALVAVLLAWLTSCGVELDLTQLTFEAPGDARSEDESAGRPAEVVTPAGAIPCSGFYPCVVKELKTGRAMETCDKRVKGVDEKALLDAIEGCRQDVCTAPDQNPQKAAFNPESLMVCLLTRCIAESVACIAGHGQEPCETLAGPWQEFYDAYQQGQGQGCAKAAESPLCLFDSLEAVSKAEQEAATSFLECAAVIFAVPGSSTFGQCMNLCNLP